AHRPLYSQALDLGSGGCGKEKRTQTRFSQEPADQTVVAGQRAVLPCVLLNYSGIVQWTKDGLALGMGQGLKGEWAMRPAQPPDYPIFSSLPHQQRLLDPTSLGSSPPWPRYRVVGSADAGQYNLEITDAELSDDASYECQATEAALRSRRAKLTIRRERGGHAEGEMPPGAGVLVIWAVLAASWTDSALLFSTVPPEDTRIDDPPTVTLSIEPQTVQEGERVVFTWAKGGFLIEDAHESRYETNVDYSFFTEPVSCEVLSNSNQLLLKSVTQADAGTYTCRAIAWAWKENFLEVGTLERYTVERTNSGSGVLSTLTINNVMEADFQTHYNCTAWNSFGPGTAIIQLEEREVLPVGIIAGATIGAGILLIFFFIALVFFLYRRRKGSRKDVTLRKLDIKVETVNREPLTMHSDREDDTASVSTATRVMKAIYSSFKDDVDLKQDLRCDTIDTREDGYAQLNTYSRAPASDYGPEPTPPGPAAPAGTDTTSQLSYENYEKFNSHPFPGAAGYPTYRLGYPQAPPSGLERTPYEAYDPIGKYATATRFSYTSQHSDYGQRFQQRMQTHV
ncbi:hypothetical protein E2I00_014116, partial [Balaenoptera physalus]